MALGTEASEEPPLNFEAFKRNHDSTDERDRCVLPAQHLAIIQVIQPKNLYKPCLNPRKQLPRGSFLLGRFATARCSQVASLRCRVKACCTGTLSRVDRLD